MKNKILTIVILVSLISSIQGFKAQAFLNQETENSPTINNSVLPYFKNVVFITWDGTNFQAFEDKIDDGTLLNAKRVDDIGYRQTIRITSHLTSTNPGLACMETGYGAEINLIPYNMFGYGTIKQSIPDNMTIAERLKATFGDDITTMFVYAWQTGEMDMTYINQQPEIDPIFNNMKAQIDYYFAAENLSWTPDDPDAQAATFHGFSESLQKYASPVMKAAYLGNVAVNFLQNVTTDRFYLRIHMTEPDQAGHGYGVKDNYGEYTEEYVQSMVDCDLATGDILDQLETMGVMDDTLIIIGADHGMYEHSHDGGIWPLNTDHITTNTFLFSNDSVEHPLGVPTYQRDIAPTILASMGVDTLTVDPPFIRSDQIGVPFWELTDTAKPIIKDAYYQIAGKLYAPMNESTKINEICNITVLIYDWCSNNIGIMKVDNLELTSTTSSWNNIVWKNIDLTSLEKGTKTFNVTITDTFGNTENKQFVSQVNAAPISVWFSILALLVVGTAVYLKKKRN